MIMDERLEFCDATALNTGGAGTYLLGDVIDLEVARDIGNGQPVYLVITVATAGGSTGSATGQFKLVSDAQEAIEDDGTATEHLATKAFPVADMTAGKVLFCGAIPLEGNEYERYLGVLQITAAAAFNAGAINAFLTLDPHGWKAYADGNV